jgi:4,5:9,10-diseco-3-hydroxy-5,9,17-trioxoandrosta-1(10),2-diene-4-oate hydrolase
VVGHSAGGAVALRLALGDPQRVRTLTLVASAGLGRGVHPLLAWVTLPVLGELAILLSRMPGGDLARTLVAAWMLFARPWRAPVGSLHEAHAVGRRPGQLESSTAMARALFDLTGQRDVLLERLPELPMPTLIVWGVWDYVLPAYQALLAVTRLPQGRLEIFPDCGHLPHIECSERFAEVLSEFLAEQRTYPQS